MNQEHKEKEVKRHVESTHRLILNSLSHTYRHPGTSLASVLGNGMQEIIESAYDAGHEARLNELRERFCKFFTAQQAALVPELKKVLHIAAECEDRKAGIRGLYGIVPKKCTGHCNVQYIHMTPVCNACDHQFVATV